MSKAKRGNFINMKKIISFTIEQDLISWLDTFSKGNPKYRNKSHFVEIALQRLKEEEVNEEKGNNRQTTEKTRTEKSTQHKRKY